MDYQIKTEFNKADPNIMHIDINSCFATIEQQANPFLRGRVMAVAPYNSEKSTIIAASREAKSLGIKTGFKVWEARKIYPSIIIVEPDIEKYKAVHNRLYQLLLEYSPIVIPKSIDEFVINFNNMPFSHGEILTKVAQIRKRISIEIGDWITVSIGMGPNRFLAKTGAGLIKPNGFVIINHFNYLEVYKKLNLTDLCGIAKRMEMRLNSSGIFSVEEFFRADLTTVKSALKSVASYHWYMNLRGWETTDFETHRSSFSHSYILKENIYNIEQAKPIINKLCVKLGWKLRKYNYMTRGIYVGISYNKLSKFKNSRIINQAIFQDQKIYQMVVDLLKKNKTNARIRQIEIFCFNIVDKNNYQCNLFHNIGKDIEFYNSIDSINKKWGQFTVRPSIMVNTDKIANERISFGQSLNTNLFE